MKYIYIHTHTNTIVSINDNRNGICIKNTREEKCFWDDVQREKRRRRKKNSSWSNIGNVETRIIRNIPTYLSFRVRILGRMVDARDGWTRPVSNKVSVQTKLESGRPGTRGRIMDGCGPRVVSRMRGSAACEPDLWPQRYDVDVSPPEPRVPRRI